MDSNNWLENLKVGDKVGIKTRLSVQVGIVEKVHKKLFVVNKMNFNKRGYRTGNSFYGGILVEMTKELEDEAMRKKLFSFIRREFDDLKPRHTLEMLEKIAHIIEGTEQWTGTSLSSLLESAKYQIR